MHVAAGVAIQRISEQQDVLLAETVALILKLLLLGGTVSEVAVVVVSLALASSVGASVVAASLLELV